MASTQFGLTLAAGGANNTAIIGIERGRLQGVCAVPTNPLHPAADAYIALYLLQGGTDLAYAIARLDSGYCTALDGPGWQGDIQLKSGMSILARGQSIIGGDFRIGLTVREQE